ncbi:MAG: thioredoxin [Thermoplasmatota archaeon]
MVEEIDDELRKLRMKKMQELQTFVEKRDVKPDLLDHPVNITDADFKSTIDKYPLVLMDFWAPWCAPCKMIGPIIESMAKEYAGKVVFAKINVDQNPGIAGALNVMGIPTMMMFKNGKLVQRVSGALPRSSLEQMIRKYL